jgi:hypothetical protein
MLFLLSRFRLFYRWLCLSGACLPVFLFAAYLPAMAQASRPVQVDLELILAVDVSGSMDGEEQRFQRAGYTSAIVHPDVVRAIQSGPNRQIALTYVEWAGDERQAITVPWQVISDLRSAQAFRDKLVATPVAYLRRTSISSILAFSAAYFDQSGVTSLKRVIDISGDGPNNDGPPVVPVRDMVLGKGIIVNGLPVMLAPTMGMGFGLDIYYRDCVVGGPGSFVLPLLHSQDWAVAIRRKLILEISGLPAQVHRTQLRPVDPSGGATNTPATDCGIGEKLRGWWQGGVE